MSVNAYTTLDYVEALVKGETFDWESVAVVNATAPKEDPDCVQLQLEVDNVREEYVPKHMTELELTPAQARRLSDQLETYADRVEAEQSE